MESRVFTVTPVNLAGTLAVPTNALIGAGTEFGAWAAAGNIGDMGIFTEQGTSLAAGPLYAAVPRLFVGALVASPTGAAKAIKTDMFDGKCMGAASLQGAVAQGTKQIVIGGWSAECETEYCLKVRFESPRVYQTYGYQSLIKTYNFVSSCCGASCACPDGDFDEVGTGITAAINADPDMLLTAVFTAESAAGVGDGFITITGVFEDEGTNGINPTYVENNSPLDFYIGLDCGFDCNGVVYGPGVALSAAMAANGGVVATALIWPQGLGADVIHKELYADGWQTSPYRIPFPLDQKSLGNNFYALAANTYDIATIEYKDCHASAITAHDVASPKKAIIAFQDNAVVLPVQTAIIASLNTWLASTPNGGIIA
jgi:hypothetical protein